MHCRNSKGRFTKCRKGARVSSLRGLGAASWGRGSVPTVADMEQWIDNDAGLYSWWKSSRLSKRAFIAENMEEIRAAIVRVRDAPPRRARGW